MTMPWLASASPTKFLNNPQSPIPHTKSPGSGGIGQTISAEIQNVRSALENHFTYKPKTPTRSPHYYPEYRHGLPVQRQPETARVHPLTFSGHRPYHNAPRSADPRLCQFPTTPTGRASPRPTPTGSPAPGTPMAHSISEKKVIKLDDPPQYEAKPSHRQAPKTSLPQPPSEWPNEKTPTSPYQPRQRPPQHPRSQHHYNAPHTAHPLGSFPMQSPRDGYYHRPSPRHDGSFSASPNSEGKRGLFDFKFTIPIPSPFSSKDNSPVDQAPRSARPRDTRRFGYYEYKTPVTGNYEMRAKGEQTPDVMFDVDCKTPRDIEMKLPEDDENTVVEKDTEQRKPVGFFEGWKVQLQEIGTRLKRRKTGRIPSFDAEAEPQTLEEIEKKLRETRVLAWTTLAGAWLMQFATFGYIFSWNVFQDYYMSNHASSHSIPKLSWIGSLQLTLCFAFGIVSGKLLDGGYFYVLTMLGSLVFGMGVFVLSFVDPSKPFQLFVVQGFFTGCGLGLVFLPSATICMFHFKERKAMMTGIAMSGSAFGAMVFPIMLDNMLDKKGFQGGVRGSSYLVIAMLVLANCLIAKPPKIWAPKYPPIDIMAYLKERHYALACGGFFLTSLVLWFPQNYIEEYAVKFSVDVNVAFYSVAVTGIAGCMGRIALGIAAERLGSWNILVLTTGGVFIMTAAMAGMYSTGAVVIVALLYGLFAGAWLSVFITCLGNLAVRPGEIGHRVGLALTIGSFGAFLSQPIHAALVGKDFQFSRAIGLCAFLVVAAAGIFVYVRILVAAKRRFQYV